MAVSLASALTLLAVAPTAANADAGYDEAWTMASSSGSSLHIRTAYVDANGSVRFRDSYYEAGPSGASVRHVKSWAK
ncbi:hypothetical protein [Actinocorallia longicatena]